MRYLQKYNESNSYEVNKIIDSLITDIIKDIELEFIDFSDDNRYSLDIDTEFACSYCDDRGFVYDEDDDYGVIIDVRIEKSTDNSYLTSFKDLIKHSDYYKEFYLDLEVCVNRIVDKYPNNLAFGLERLSNSNVVITLFITDIITYKILEINDEAH